jgi:hypothetical protein
MMRRTGAERINVVRKFEYDGDPRRRVIREGFFQVGPDDTFEDLLLVIGELVADEPGSVSFYNDGGEFIRDTSRNVLEVVFRHGYRSRLAISVGFAWVDVSLLPVSRQPSAGGRPRSQWWIEGRLVEPPSRWDDIWTANDLAQPA